MVSANLALHVTPRSGRDCVSGIKHEDLNGTEVHVRVTAPPDGGKANKAVIKLLAKQLHVPKSACELVRGETSRHKLVSVPLSEDELKAWTDGLPVL